MKLWAPGAAILILLGASVAALASTAGAAPDPKPAADCQPFGASDLSR
jgi:hypothetical protein